MKVGLREKAGGEFMTKMSATKIVVIAGLAALACGKAGAIDTATVNSLAAIQERTQRQLKTAITLNKLENAGAPFDGSIPAKTGGEVDASEASQTRGKDAAPPLETSSNITLGNIAKIQKQENKRPEELRTEKDFKAAWNCDGFADCIGKVLSAPKTPLDTMVDSYKVASEEFEAEGMGGAKVPFGAFAGLVGLGWGALVAESIICVGLGRAVGKLFQGKI